MYYTIGLVAVLVAYFLVTDVIGDIKTGVFFEKDQLAYRFTFMIIAIVSYTVIYHYTIGLES